MITENSAEKGITENEPDLDILRKNERKKRFRIGYMMALFCAILWGLWYVPSEVIWVLNPFNEMSISIGNTHGDTTAFLVVAILISAFNATTAIVALLVWNGALGKFSEMRRTARELRSCNKWFFLASFFGGPIAICGSFIAMGFVGAAFAAVSALLYPVVGSVLSYRWLGQNISRRAILGIIIIMTGGATLYAGGLINDLSNGGGSFWGYIGGIMAACGWGIEGAVASRGLDVSDPDVGVALRFVGENIIWWAIIIPLLALAGIPMYTYALMVFDPLTLLVLTLAGISIGFAYVSEYKAFPLIGVGREQGVGNLFGLFAVVFLFLFVGQIPEWTILLGGTMCVIGSLVMFTEENMELRPLKGGHEL